MAQRRKAWYQWPDRWQSFREVPWTRLWIFLAAVFLLFSVIGFFNDLIRMGAMPYATVILLAVVTGLNAVLFLLFASYLPWPFIGILVALQFVLGPVLTVLFSWMDHRFALSTPSADTGIRFAGTAILFVVITSYILFVIYFRAESRATMLLRNELALAHGIQKTLVPPVMLAAAGFEIYGLSEPSEKVGGDLVDVVELPGGDVVAYVADIAGHGLSAGILMGMLKTAARTVLLDPGPPETSLPLLLDKLNRVLPGVKEPQMYATLTAFRLNADGRVWYAMAASPPILHKRLRGQDLQMVQEHQLPLGLLPEAAFVGRMMDLTAGDVLLVATDGILEVCDQNEEEFSPARLEDTLMACADQPLAAVAREILSRARAFGPQTDDQTLLLIRRSAQPPPRMAALIEAGVSSKT
ncbi:MAG TPA: PP2C family protein-serine/threonine phosphatase [Acidobacteriaceae bacterium]|nr:PP2C family protein-serine/threonine phosphatase [Acidobacteriaceae bacterium]